MDKIELPSLKRSPSGDHTVQLAPGMPHLPERLLLAHAEGRVLIIAGAGVSMQSPACLPDFGSLVRRVFAHLDKAIGANLAASRDDANAPEQTRSLPPLDAEQAAMLHRVISKEYDVALGMLERRMDSDQAKESTVRRAVAEILREATTHSPIHTSLVRLANRGGAATIATTNFDLLLESAASALRKPLPLYSLQGIPRPSLRPEFSGVLHLHGALDPDPRRHPDLVLTDRDFGEHYLRRRAIPDFIYDVARIFHIVLVGYSLADPPMRYLLNAVAADGQRFSDLKERFAFVGMNTSSDHATEVRRQMELATWKGRGITPIPYDKSEGHQALSKVLENWAEYSPHGKSGRTVKEARRILSLPRAAASESSAALFGHLFRRSSDEMQARMANNARDLRADPAWLDGMIEVVREKGTAHDREAHVSRLCQIVLTNCLNDRRMLRWAAQLAPTRISERRAVLEVLDLQYDAASSEPWITAWSLIAESYREPTHNGRRHQDYRLGQRLKSGERSGSLIGDIAREIGPRLKVEWRADSGFHSVKVPVRPRKVNDILHLSLTSGTIDLGRTISLDDVTDVDFLVELAETLEAEVARGLKIGRRIGWHADRSLIWLGGLDHVSLDVASGDDEEPDRFHRGIAPVVRLLVHTIGRLGKLKPATGTPFMQRWLTRQDPVHTKMWAAVGVIPALADPEQVKLFLLKLPPSYNWKSTHYPEVTLLRALRFRDMDLPSQKLIVDFLIKGPPPSIFNVRHMRMDKQRFLNGLIVRELTRLQAAGAELPPRALNWLRLREARYQEFVATTVSTDFPKDVHSGWLAPNPDTSLDSLDGERLAAAVDERLRIGDHWTGPASGIWDWLDDGGNALRLAQSLLAAESSFGRLGMAWNALGLRFHPRDRNAPDQTPSTQAIEVLHSISEMDDVVLQEATTGLSNWLERWSSTFNEEGALLRAILRLWEFGAAASNRSMDLTDYKDEEGAEAKRVAHDSLNSPIGNLVGAFLQACPNLLKVPLPFKLLTDLRTVRDLIETTPGYAGVVARYRCATGLPYFMHADGGWTEDALLSRLEEGPESDVLWHAVAHSRLTRNVMVRLGRLMARRAVNGGLEMEVRRSLVERVCFDMLGGIYRAQTNFDLLPEAQQMLRAVPDELRAHAAHSVKRFMDDVVNSGGVTPVSREEIFDRAVEPFLRDVWPQERAVVTPAVSEAFASVPAASCRRFDRAVAAIRRFLVPFESWSMYHWGLVSDTGSGIREGVVVGPAEAAAALDLLDLTIGKGADVRIPHGLDAALAVIAMENPALRRDTRFARLATLTRT
jgi:hypothetical protein